jgi:uracil-DNA glycosylase family protein
MKKVPHNESKRLGPSKNTVLVLNASSIAELRQASARCNACDLFKRATQTVFGEGAPNARIMFVGEQPGDQEDRSGHPFVGPAGKLLNEALAEAGIERTDVYVTNVVKHFSWTVSERRKRRIHKKPRYSEIQACRPWLDAELRVIKPEILVCLGSDGCAVAIREDVQREPPTRAVGRVLAGSLRDRHSASFVDSPGTRRQVSTPADAGVR